MSCLNGCSLCACANAITLDDQYADVTNRYSDKHRLTQEIVQYVVMQDRVPCRTRMNHCQADRRYINPNRIALANVNEQSGLYNNPPEP